MARNSSTFLTYNGETHSLNQWAGITGIKFHTLYKRHHQKWTTAQILGFDPPPRIVRGKNKTPDTRQLMNTPPVHPISTVYAIHEGKPVQLEKQPRWMTENCQ